jgi:hypothetical protein
MFIITRQQFLEDKKNLNKDELLLFYTDLCCCRPMNCTDSLMCQAYSNHCGSPSRDLKIVLQYIIDNGLPIGAEYTGIHKYIKAWQERNILVFTNT